jgi:small-conductance mechanosensitive channel
MEFLKDLAGSLFLIALLSIALYVASTVAIGFLSRKSSLLKPVGSGLNLIALFLAVQVFVRLGAAEHAPRVARQLDFFSWLLFVFAALRLVLYLYGDLFVVRWKRGSFPAAFKNIITAAALVVVALVLLKEILNINVTSLIATTTVLTATIGLAFQSTLANMLAGLTIHLEKPLRQGDWISVGGHEGLVLDISLRSTRIRTIEHNEIFIPNSKVLSEAVVNFSLPDASLVRKLGVGVSYAIAPNKVIDAIKAVLGSVPGVLEHPEQRVRVVRYGDFSIDYEIRYMIDDFSRHVELEAGIMNLLWYRFKREGIEIPFPIRNVNLTRITEEGRQAERERKTEALTSLMERVDIFTPLSRAELRSLIGTVRLETYAAGEFVVRQGEAGASFYIIKRGKVDVLVEKSPRECAVVATLGPGNFFGEMSLLTGATRTASVRVREDAEFIVIDKESFGSTLVDNPSIAEALSHILSERQAGLDAERDRLDAAQFERSRKDASSRMLSKIRDFFGLKSQSAN